MEKTGVLIQMYPAVKIERRLLQPKEVASSDLIVQELEILEKGGSGSHTQ
jgi:hypothetical protein